MWTWVLGEFPIAAHLKRLDSNELNPTFDFGFQPQTVHKNWTKLFKFYFNFTFLILFYEDKTQKLKALTVFPKCIYFARKKKPNDTQI